jgi:hypothetical protein
LHPLREHSSAGSEHLPYKQGVTGSNPVAPTNSPASCGIFFCPYKIQGAHPPRLEKKIGNENWQLVTSKKVKIDMSQKLCRASWGEQNKVDLTILQDLQPEQWFMKKLFTN